MCSKVVPFLIARTVISEFIQYIKPCLFCVKTSTFWFPECWLMKTLTPFSAIARVAEMLKPNRRDVETMDDDDQGDVEAQVDLLP